MASVMRTIERRMIRNDPGRWMHLLKHGAKRIKGWLR